MGKYKVLESCDKRIEKQYHRDGRHHELDDRCEIPTSEMAMDRFSFT